MTNGVDIAIYIVYCKVLYFVAAVSVAKMAAPCRVPRKSVTDSIFTLQHTSNTVNTVRLPFHQS